MKSSLVDLVGFIPYPDPAIQIFSDPSHNNSFEL